MFFDKKDEKTTFILYKNLLKKNITKFGAMYV